MSQALDAMVRAMIAEIDRQHAEEDAMPYVGDGFTPSVLRIDGEIDLEKIARAGLAAIDEPSPDHEIFEGHDPAAPQAFHDMIRAMLGERPRLELLGGPKGGHWKVLKDDQ